MEAFVAFHYGLKIAFIILFMQLNYQSSCEKSYESSHFISLRHPAEYFGLLRDRFVDEDVWNSDD